MRSLFCKRLAVFIAFATVTACSNGIPLGPATPTNATAATTAPSSPTPPATPTTSTTSTTAPTAVAYTPDLQPIFNSDCVPCHGARSAAARYSMTSYTGVMAAVWPRSASSPLVIVTQPGGLMYSFLSGDRGTRAALIRTWVLNGAPQTR